MRKITQVTYAIYRYSIRGKIVANKHVSMNSIRNKHGLAWLNFPSESSVSVTRYRDICNYHNSRILDRNSDWCRYAPITIAKEAKISEASDQTTSIRQTILDIGGITWTRVYDAQTHNSEYTDPCVALGIEIM